MIHVHDNFKDFLDSGRIRQHTFFRYDTEDFNPKRKPIVVLYHENCWDGVTAAWCAWLKFKSTAVYIPVNYNRPLPNLDWTKVSQVYILDFSYPTDVLDELYALVNGNLLVLDHHKTAEAQLKGRSYAVFNKKLSGAGLSWLYFQEKYTQHALKKVAHRAYGNGAFWGRMPKFVYFAQDYDLWAFKDKDTEAFRATVDLYSRKIETLQKIHDARVNGTNPLNVNNMVKRGKPLIEQRDKMLKEAASTAFKMTYPGQEKAGYGVVIANPSLSSYLGNILATKSKAEGDGGYSVVFQVNSKSIDSGKVLLSIRGAKGVDVTPLALAYGGGGHAGASGCSWDYAFFLQFLAHLGYNPKVNGSKEA